MLSGTFYATDGYGLNTDWGNTVCSCPDTNSRGDCSGTGPDFPIYEISYRCYRMQDSIGQNGLFYCRELRSLCCRVLQERTVRRTRCFFLFDDVLRIFL